MSSKAKNKSHIKRSSMPACLPVLFNWAHVWGFHRIGLARSPSFLCHNEDRMCAFLFCRNVRLSKQWGGERRQKGPGLVSMCVKLSEWNLHWGKEVFEKVFSKGKTSPPRSTRHWKGQISCIAAGKESEPGEPARRSLCFSPFPNVGCTHAFTITANTPSSL